MSSVARRADAASGLDFRADALKLICCLPFWATRLRTFVLHTDFCVLLPVLAICGSSAGAFEAVALLLLLQLAMV